MAFNNLITRGDGQALIPEVVSDAILKNLMSESAAMKLFRRIPMSTNQTRMPVLSALPTAYFVNGDTGLKQTTKTAWANKFLNVEEIAAIVPIPENLLDDMSFDTFGAVQPLIEQAIGRTLDDAIFFDVNRPASWPAAIVTDAIARGHKQTRTTNTSAKGAIAGDISDIFGTLEADGYDVNGVLAKTTYKGLLRNARDTQGRKLDELSVTEVYGAGVTYPMRGLWPTGTGTAGLIAGDFTQGILGVRKDMTMKLLTEAVITDNTGAIIYNLPQQDMVAIRVTFRPAFQIANTINYDNPDGTTRYPWAVLLEP